MSYSLRKRKLPVETKSDTDKSKSESNRKLTRSQSSSSTSKLTRTNGNSNEQVCTQQLITQNNCDVSKPKRKCVDDQHDQHKEPASSSSEKITEENQLPEWNNLPEHVLIQIYLFLDPNDRRQASATCKQWRECYFYPICWRNIQLCRGDMTWCPKLETKVPATTSWNGAELLIDRCGKYAHNVQIFPFMKTSWEELVNCTQPSIHVIGSHRPSYSSEELNNHSEQIFNKEIQQMMSAIPDLLEKLCNQCKNMNSFQLNLPRHPHLCGADYPRLEKSIWDKLAALLQLSPAIQHFKVGSFLDVIGKSNMLSQLVQLCGKTLQTLHCPVYLLDDEPAPNLAPFKQLVHLTDLSLNLCYVTDKLVRILASPDHCPMTSLSILSTESEELYDDETTNTSWQALVTHSPQLKVKIASQFSGGSMGGAIHVAGLLQQSAIPLHQLKLVSPGIIPNVVFDLLQNNFRSTLHHLELICPNDIGFAVAIGRRTEPNPVVLTMWQCIHITHLVIAGFQITADDVVGIARLSTRLRGENLDVLRIQGSMIKYEEPVETEEELVAEVSKCLGKDWQPMDDMDSELTLWELMENPLFPDNEFGSGPTS